MFFPFVSPWSQRARWRLLWRGGLRRLWWRRPRLLPDDAADEPPLRATLFSAEQMAHYGTLLAQGHVLARDSRPDALLARLAANEAMLIDVCQRLSATVPAPQPVSPAAEWLLDNFYLIEAQIRLARRHLPRGYSRTLPRLVPAPGILAGQPRIYDIAIEIITHVDSRLDTDGLERFVRAYQAVTPLTLGELWAIPIMLRLAVIENLRRVAVRTAAGSAARNLADSWADQMGEAAENDPKSLILLVADMARSNPPMISTFVAELSRRLQGRGPALLLPLTWIAQRLEESGLSIEQLVQSENRQQAADQVSISNSIGSLRYLAAMNWRDFVERMSAVEQVLQQDPQGVYPRMDFATRDRYRHVVESLARHGTLDESAVAALAVQLAGQTGSAARPGSLHVGYYLVGEGLEQLQRAANVRLPWSSRLCGQARRHAVLLYLGGILGLSGGFAAVLLWQAQASGAGGWPLLLLGVPAVLAMSQLAVTLVNHVATLLVVPVLLPRLDFAAAIAPQARTLVVVPTMLDSHAGVDSLLAALEVRYLANRGAYLHFGLLTDMGDAASESLPGDAALLARVRDGIARLNRQYDGDSAVFFLFHRPRRWNARAGQWMGEERKRGKLADLNRLLRSGERDIAASGFAVVEGERAVLAQVRYVITLDTDTQLPRDAARQLIAIMAHPLNQPLYDAARGMVVAGYGILQPRVASSLPGTGRSRYARLYGGDAGIDPYSRAVSDVYQDVFGQGSFIGKGIYDVDMFARVLDGRFPDNRILSHDLLEGCYLRAGLVSDVQLYEDYPARYSSDVSRRYRWIRGDWQLLAWLGRQVPLRLTVAANPLSWLSQWKLLDNLRRSLVAAALLGLLVWGWLMLPAAAMWTLSLAGVLLASALVAALLAVLRKPHDVPLRGHLAGVLQGVGHPVRQAAFELGCLPYEASYSLGAMLRTLWRLTVSHRHLLQWHPSAEAARTLALHHHASLAASYRRMLAAPLLALVLLLWLPLYHPVALPAAAPLLLAWLAAPWLAWWLSLPLSPHPPAPDAAQVRLLRLLSRRTWAFFARYVSEEDHWLPPDNVQALRADAIAHRTSPTNIGLGLLATLAAWDFGYLCTRSLLQRTGLTFQTLSQLARHRGHFYNWYDTQTLQPLPPLYVSSVDSGNLAGHLLTLRAGLLALAEAPLLTPRLYDGLGDTLLALLHDSEGAVAARAALLLAMQDAATLAADDTLPVQRARLQQLQQEAAQLQALLAASPSSPALPWLAALLQQSAEAEQALLWSLPWLLLPPPPEGLADCAMPLQIASLRQLLRQETPAQARITQHWQQAVSPAQRDWLAAARQAWQLAASRAAGQLLQIGRLAQQAGELAQMEYGFLYDKARCLLSIGYNVSECRRDAGFYDLLASEMRLGCFVAIAQGQLPQESWFALGRLLTGQRGEPVLLSWSGSMFEYLMPLLVMPSYAHTLLAQTCQAAVARQIRYGQQRGVPWGVSESGYHAVDLQQNYQYHAFGVPGLGLKRGLADDLVIAPYAAVLALMVAPEAASRNLQRLAADGMLGQYGFFEALDYTPLRQLRGQVRTVVRAFMAHHQGMSLLALAHCLLDQPMQRRFVADPQLQASLLLLQERIPRAGARFAHHTRRFDAQREAEPPQLPARRLVSPQTPQPEVQLLSNGRYHVMLTQAGGGYSRWKGLAVTRWQEDSTCDNWGMFCYLRDLGSGQLWSASHQPVQKQAQAQEIIFSEGRAEFRRCDELAAGEGLIETYTEIVVSPEDDIELRRLRISNRSRSRREIDITSYAEVVLAPALADALHPAFSKLFVQSEILPSRHGILCSRRPRTPQEPVPYLLHLMMLHGATATGISYETDRLRFVGRGRSAASPLAMQSSGPLSGTDGAVLDPVVAIRYRLLLEPEQSVLVDMVTGMADSREQAIALLDKYQDRHLAARVFDLAWTHSQVLLRQLNAGEAEAQLYARLAGAVLYAGARLRADPVLLVGNRRSQSGLWGYAISGDLPIVLLQIADAANVALVRQLVQAHAYWRQKGLRVDLVIWNEDRAGYRQQLQDQILGLIAAGVEAGVIDRPGGIFLRAAEHIPPEDRVLLQAVARVVLSDACGTLAEQLDRGVMRQPLPPPLVPARRYRPVQPMADRTMPPLLMFNGYGGFTGDGRCYEIRLAAGQQTPAPWVNVLANAEFGSVVSESGAAYTWAGNAHEYRLSPWHDDAVSDRCGEALYLRDEETGHVWSPSPWPAGGALSYVIRHGFGCSEFETLSDGILSCLRVFVARDAAVKFSQLTLHNVSGRVRQVSITGYVGWVLGDLPAKSAMHVCTEIAPASGALYARNVYNSEFADNVAFFDVDDHTRKLTADRREFIGRNGSLRHPAALGRTTLSGKVGAGLDPCAAIQLQRTLLPDARAEVVFRLGAGRSRADAAALVERFRGPDAANLALAAVQQYWQHTLGAVQVHTPDRALDLLANGWLVYQTLGCRLWARSGYYQSGGAFGFRDQLQDGMALVHAEPALVRAHLLRCASRQFPEGDVQHWWHPPAGRGVRTRCSDDYLWLPLAVCRYVAVSGDSGILGEAVLFLEGRPLNADEAAYYDLPASAMAAASLYAHCKLALMRASAVGDHGLPLMGSGDWNDGMDRVGVHGRGESVWLGFFLCEVLRRFAPLARSQGDDDFALQCDMRRQTLAAQLEQHGWDGAWYRRAYFDDGSPLGSASGAACRIDSVSQSWAVLSGVASPARAQQAMASLKRHLVRPEAMLVQLLDPPFDQGELDPGYIRGYVPGVRENGGQYTHAAIWAAMACAAQGDAVGTAQLLAMINPLNHGGDAAAIARYRIEPYVMAADVYALPPHTGRGGWSWYTGAAGWMYRLVLESVLGLVREGALLRLTPCVPADWSHYRIDYRFGATPYRIDVVRGVAAGMTLDGVAVAGEAIRLCDDGVPHCVCLTLPP